ncbi:RNA-binding protein 12B-like [Myxocyprinus asiaticus]|uniref:RNA-binding protein 12B-like n=1 Tax=Myxocyprinus asiaticus TaxID=70543 RepID=UPI00222268DF|nr:RNA-binding protein 12B-like [Myxocyprinus asiaticus]XP_051574930.1 RNA-binding protein 12B-like [Myxocyprinus asiaticus]
MTIVVLRLQGLHTEAGSEDIRRFFHGLNIPGGGVHITGGEMGKAFIIFNTEREGQLAMRYSGKPLRGSAISLFISSLAELKHSMESMLKRAKSSAGATKTVPLTSSSPDNNAGLSCSLTSSIQGLHSKNNGNQCQMPQAMNNRSPALNQIYKVFNQTVQDKQQSSSDSQTNADFTHPVKLTHDLAFKEQQCRNINSCKPGYLRLYGFPDSADKQEVLRFLRGLSVSEVFMKVRLQLGWCCLAKVSSFAEAEEGLKYSQRKFKEFNIEVRLAHEKMWTDAVEQSKNHTDNMESHAFSEQNKTFPERNTFRGFSSKRSTEELPSPGSPKRYCQNSPSPQTELYVIVKNLSKNITKTEIKNIFGCHEIPNSQIKHLLNKWGERTCTAFINFGHAEDYASALNMNGTTVGLKNIEVSSITKEEMFAILSRNRCTKSWRPYPYGKAHFAMSCVYTRNFPADVKKIQVKDFFTPFNICENDIALLVDSQGKGVGEAIVQFGCEEIAIQAQSLHGKFFMGAKILITCITRQQMEKIIGTR